MHDCPTCKIPLHGHEEVCPSCGTKQYVRPEFRKSNLPPPPGVNPLPFIILIVIIGIIGVVALQGSWIGQLITNPPKDDPMASITPVDARSKIEAGINGNLSGIGAKAASFAYTANGQPAFKNTIGIVEMSANVTLADPEQRRKVVDPIKDLMVPAKVSSLVVKDEKHHREWTYTASIPPPTSPDSTIDSSGLDGTTTTGTGGDTTQPDSATQ